MKLVTSENLRPINRIWSSSRRGQLQTTWTGHSMTWRNCEKLIEKIRRKSKKYNYRQPSKKSSKSSSLLRWSHERKTCRCRMLWPWPTTGQAIDLAQIVLIIPHQHSQADQAITHLWNSIKQLRLLIIIWVLRHASNQPSEMSTLIRIWVHQSLRPVE